MIKTKRPGAVSGPMLDALDRANGLVDGGGLRLNVGKNRWDLLPLDAVDEVVKVLTVGASKYAARNWERGMAYSICLASALRHIVKRAMGELRDPETGMLHTACAACNLMFLTAYDARGMQQMDDLEPYARSFKTTNKKPRRPNK